MSTKSVLEALMPETRRRILSELVRCQDESVHVRELARRIGMDANGILRECRNLESAGVLRRRSAGNQVIFSLNPDSPVSREIRMLIVKTSGIADVIRDAFIQSRLKIDFAYIYGSYATGDFQNHSDIDVLIVSDAPTCDFSQALSQAERIIGREINAVICTPDEYETEVISAGSFIHGVSSSKRISLIGRQNEH